ncbi:tRNA1(Val) A37 N6-methylase TrmN6 [Pelagirhabdus alkalitolerans]|uniref:tRNA1(Val) A37 N6-methylase TrmN6 n=1 Tax=Pelagirhabdus alkalitolerans TaxID=1612202 RepID=A0A1G6MKQ1_9BACI|nr:tRNA1(Val) (adenine(37)-N6)-methyltransferase [Pelagirhabdus alkalitolerans]SDC56089.1 tRNA1(Val) A37 N6-methylase TrmN6 [Pelagirhabdus alkalitolerans]
MVLLRDDERLDDLFTDQTMKIIQSECVFSYSIDAVLLARFASVPLKRGKIIDLCTGNGVIPLMLSRASSVPITGVEIQERLYDMAKRSVTLNQKEAQIHMIHDDLKNMPKQIGNDKFDLVTVNPPYFQTNSQDHLNKNDHLTIARHELFVNLEEVIETTSKLVKSGGKVAIVHRPNRLVDLLTLMRFYKLEPKRIQFVYPKKGKEANILLVEAIRDGRPDVKLLDPLYVFNSDGSYTEELRQLVF